MTEPSNETEKRKLKIKCPGCGQKLDLTGVESFSHVSCPVCNKDIVVPKWFDTFLLENECGSGNMAEVYRSLDLALEREVAIKILKEEKAADASGGELFLHEAKSSATLNHGSIVPTYTCGSAEGRPYIVMQYMQKGSLAEQIKNCGNKIPMENIIQWLRDVAEGLNFALEHKVLHHDIKPENILLDSDGNAKVSDFGIVQILASSEAVKSGDVKKLWFNSLYVSPEKITSGQEDQKGDIYSLGAVFYHVITGTVPFHHSDTNELIRMRLTNQPASLEQFRENLDPEISSLILSMMNSDPAKRPEYKDILSSLDKIKNRKTDRKPDESGQAEKKASMKPAPAIKRRKRTRMILKTIIGFLNTLIAFGLVGAVVYLWYEGYLEKWLPFNISVPHAREELKNLDPHPEISWHQAHGNWKSAKEYAFLAMSNGQNKSPERVVAMFQYSCASLLASDKTSGVREEIAAAIAPFESGLDVATVRSAGMEPLLSLVLCMVKVRSDVPNQESIHPMQSVAYFLLAVYDREPKTQVLNRLSAVSGFLDDLPEEHWLVKSFRPRLSRWQQVIGEGNGIEEETEPLFRFYLEEEKSWHEVSTADEVMKIPESWESGKK